MYEDFESWKNEVLGQFPDSVDAEYSITEDVEEALKDLWDEMQNEVASSSEMDILYEDYLSRGVDVVTEMTEILSAYGDDLDIAISIDRAMSRDD